MRSRDSLSGTTPAGVRHECDHSGLSAARPMCTVARGHAGRGAKSVDRWDNKAGADPACQEPANDSGRWRRRAPARQPRQAHESYVEPSRRADNWTPSAPTSRFTSAPRAASWLASRMSRVRTSFPLQNHRRPQHDAQIVRRTRAPDPFASRGLVRHRL